MKASRWLPGLTLLGLSLALALAWHARQPAPDPGLRPAAERLSAPDPADRLAAAAELGEAPDPVPAARALAPALGDPDAAVRGAVTAALVKLEAVDTLRDALTLGEPPARVQAALGFAQLGGRAGSALPDLITALADSEERVRLAAALALLALEQRPEVRPGFEALLRRDDFAGAWARLVLRGAPSPEDHAVLPPLLSGLADPEPLIRAGAARGLRKVVRVLRQGPTARPALERAFADPAAGPDAAEALAELLPREPSVLDFFLSRLADPDPVLRARAAGQLRWAVRPGGPAPGSLTGEAGLTTLIGGLDDPSNDVRLACTEVLGKLGPAAGPAVPRLVGLLVGPDKQLAGQAALALGEIRAGGDEVPRKLLTACSDTDPRLREQATAALGLFGPAALPVLARALDDLDLDVVERAAEAVGRIGVAARPAAPALLRALKSDRPALRVVAAEALWLTDPPRWPALLDPLADALGDRDPVCSARAAQTLAAIGPLALPVFPRIRAALGSPDAETRTGAARAIAALGPLAGEAAADLGRVAGDWREGILALGALGPAGKPGAAALRHALEGELALEAACALARVDPADRAAIPVLLRESASPFADNRVAAAYALARLGPPVADGALPALVRRLLGESSPGADLILAFEQMGPASRPALAKALTDPATQPGALQVLAQIPLEGEPGQAALTPLLREREAEFRRGAALALARGGHVSALGDALGSPETREPALAGLTELGPRAAAAVGPLANLLTAGPKEARPPALRALAAIGPAARDAGPPIRALLMDRSAESAAALLAIFPGDPEAIGALRKALEDRGGRSRALAAHALGLAGPAARDSTTALLAALTDPDPVLRGAAAEALPRVGADPTVAVPALAAAVRAGGRNARPRAVAALGGYSRQARSAVPALAELLDNRQGGPEVATALGRIGPDARAAIPALTDSLYATRPQAELAPAGRKLAEAQALWRISADAGLALPGLLAALDGDHPGQAEAGVVSVLGEMGEAALPAVAAVASRLFAARPATRLLALEALERMGPKGLRDARPALELARSDRDPGVRDRVGRVLGRLGK